MSKLNGTNNKKINKRKKKRKNTDIIFVVFIFALIILMAVFFAWIQSGKNFQSISKNGNKGGFKDITSNEAVVISMGILATIGVIVFTVSRIKSNIKKKRIIEEKMRKLQEIAEARERVNNAKYEDILSAGRDALKERRNLRGSYGDNDYVRHKYDLNHTEDELENDTEEYGRRRRYYMYDEEYNDSDEGDIMDYDYMEEDDIDYHKSNKKIIIIGSVAVIAMVVMVIISLL